MLQDPVKPIECKILIHYLNGMEYTGRPYRGTREQFNAELDRYIKAYKTREECKVGQSG